MKKLALLALGLLVAACSETPTETPTLDAPPLALAKGGGGVVAHASGAGIITWALDLYLGGDLYEIYGDETYGFTVNQFADGSAKGQFQANWSRTDGYMFHMALDCLDVQGNMAFVSGTVTKVSPNEITSVGDPFVFWIEDNGRGVDAAPDRISLFFRPPFLPEDAVRCDSPVAQQIIYDQWVVDMNAASADNAGNIQIWTR